MRPAALAALTTLAALAAPATAQAQTAPVTWSHVDGAEVRPGTAVSVTLAKGPAIVRAFRVNRSGRRVGAAFRKRATAGTVRVPLGRTLSRYRVTVTVGGRTYRRTYAVVRKPSAPPAPPCPATAAPAVNATLTLADTTLAPGETARLVLANAGPSCLSYGAQLRTERLTDAGWQPVPDDRAFIMVAYRIFPGLTNELSFTLPDGLAPGRHRLALDVSPEPAPGAQPQPLHAEFDVVAR